MLDESIIGNLAYSVALVSLWSRLHHSNDKRDNYFLLVTIIYTRQSKTRKTGQCWIVRGEVIQYIVEALYLILQGQPAFPFREIIKI